MILVTADLLQKKDHSLTGPLTEQFNFLITLICHLVVQCQSQPSFSLIILLIFLIAQRIFDSDNPGHRRKLEQSAKAQRHAVRKSGWTQWTGKERKNGATT